MQFGKAELESQTPQLAQLKQELETARSRAYREAQLAASRESLLLEQRDYFKQQAEKLRVLQDLLC